MEEKKDEKEKNELLSEELQIDKGELKKLKKKLLKLERRADRGAETLFRLVSKNHYTLNVMIDRKSSIMISMNAVILSIIIGTVLNRLDEDPLLLFPAIIMLATNMISMTYAVLATMPALKHGSRNSDNVMFYGNFSSMQEEEYTEDITGLIYKGDELYSVIAKDTYYLGKEIDKKFRFLRHSFFVFLFGIIVSVFGFIVFHVFFS